MKRREATTDELLKRPALTVTEAQQVTGYSRVEIYARIADKTYRANNRTGGRWMIVTKSLFDGEETLAAKATEAAS